MKALLEWIRKDMKPALGVTEPAAIALACAAARAMTEEPAECLLVRENSGIYKNAFTCGIPGTDKIGNEFAAALGCVAGDKEKGLLVLEEISDADVEAAKRFIEDGKVKVEVSQISSELFIYACVRTEHDCCEAEIRGQHTNICRLVKNGRVLLEKKTRELEETARPGSLTDYTMEEFFRFAKETPVEDLYFIREAYRVNLELAKAALTSERCTLTKSLLAFNGGTDVSGDLRATARFFAGAASEARVLGLISRR